MLGYIERSCKTTANSRFVELELKWKIAGPLFTRAALAQLSAYARQIPFGKITTSVRADARSCLKKT